jgi:hypothetical protein
VLGSATPALADETRYDSSDVIAAIHQASEEIGVSEAWLYRVVDCETGHTFNPYAIGDHGTSLGMAQLHMGGGELVRFLAWGYDSPFDPYQAARFMAQEFAFGRAGSWSCA